MEPPVRPASQNRINDQIRAPKVRLVDDDGSQIGIKATAEALEYAYGKGLDLVEIAAQSDPPVAKVMDYGKYRYEQAKKDKEARKHQHANKVKEIQLSPQIDPHDFGVKLSHAIEFLCEDMKVKVTLRFRGREMAHKEFGFQQVEKFTKEVAPYGHPDFEAKLVGKGITVMFSPLPRNKRANNPHQGDASAPHEPGQKPHAAGVDLAAMPVQVNRDGPVASKQPTVAFQNNPFAKLDLNQSQEPPQKPAAES